MSERRKYIRLLHEQPCVVVMEGRRFPSRLIDVSLKGALMKSPAGLDANPGAHVTLEIPLGDGTSEVIAMAAQVVSTQSGRLGLSCSSIDVDSITHLRRLLELNSGDAALIERELSALGRGQ
jgi:hypothetical protein